MALAVTARPAPARIQSTRVYENRLKPITDPTADPGGFPAVCRAGSRSRAVRGADVDRRSRRRSGCPGLAVLVQRSWNHRGAQPAAGGPHRGDRGPPVGHRRWPGLAHSRAGRCGVSVHARQEQDRPRPRRHGHQSVPEITPKQGPPGGLQPPRHRRPDSQEDLSIVPRPAQ